MRSPGRAALLATAIALQAGLAVDSMRRNSATFDEGAHLPAGYTYLALGDHRLNPEQPPLVKLLAAAPLLAARPLLRTDDRAWSEGRQWEFGRRFLYRWNDADRLLFLGRLSVVALASCLLAAVFIETRGRFGDRAAALALLLAALSPDVLAHGSIVTTDLGLALFFFLSVAAFDRLVERATPVRLLVAGLALGAALATKFSAPILGPVLGALLVLAVLDGRPMDSALAGPSRTITGVTARGRHGLLLLTGVTALAVGVVWSSYGFRHALSPDPAVRATLRTPLDAPAAGLLRQAAVTAANAGLLPEDYARGLVFVMTHSEARSAFLLGRLSDHGFPHYFLVTFLLKTPVPLVLLAILAGIRAWRLPWRDRAFVWLPVVIYVGFTCTRGLQIGHRHLLPVYPFLFVAAGEAAAALWSWRRPAGLALAALLAVWYAAGTLLNHPHHLAYFNEVAGGPANGWRLLSDSNLDWGQDLKRLKAWMDAQGVARIKLSYFGSADPAYYGIGAVALPGYTAPHAPSVTREIHRGDIVAVSATNLQGVYLDPVDRPLMERIKQLPPIARVGYSILVYRVDFDWPGPAEVGRGPAP
jgi:hypothetical protein